MRRTRSPTKTLGERVKFVHKRFLAVHWRDMIDRDLEIDEWIRYVPSPRRLGTNRFGIENYAQIGRVVSFSVSDAPVIALLTRQGRLERAQVLGEDLVRTVPSCEEELSYLVATLEV